MIAMLVELALLYTAVRVVKPAEYLLSGVRMLGFGHAHKQIAGEDFHFAGVVLLEQPKKTPLDVAVVRIFQNLEQYGEEVLFVVVF